MSQTRVSHLAYWRIQSAQIVAELFPVTSSEAWDELLDFHTQLLQGTQMDALLDQFLRCRHLLEADHYIPFYRLRRLIEASLRLEARVGVENQPAQEVPLRPILWKAFRSVEEIRQKIRRNLFEHDLNFSLRDSLQLEVKELAGV